MTSTQLFAAQPEAEPPLEINAGPGVSETSDQLAVDPAPAIEIEATESAEPAPAAESAEALETAPNEAIAPAAEPLEVSVVGSPLARAPGAAQIVGRAQLERFEYDDPHAPLQQVPGVYVRQEDGFGLRPNIGIRGGNPDRSKKLTLLEDGVLFGPAPYSAPAAYYFPLVTRMSAIQVIKGPSAIAYGPQTIGGAVNFVTRPVPANPEGVVDLGLGAYGYQKAHGYFGASNERFGFVVEGVRLHTSGFKELPAAADTGFTRNEWMAKASYVLDPWSATHQEFALKLSYSDEVSNETYLGLSDADFRQNPNRRYPASSLDQMRNHRSSLVLSHKLEHAASSLKLESHAYRHEYARVWRKLNRFAGASLSEVLSDPNTPANAEFYAILSGEADSVTAGGTLMIGPNDRRFFSQGLASALRLDIRTKALAHRVEGGLRLHHDGIVRQHSERGYQMLDGELFPLDAAPSVTTANQASSTALAAHASDAVSFRDLTLSPGLRVEVIGSTFEDRLSRQQSTNTVVALMPGVGSYYSILPSLGVLAGAYRGFSPPPPGGDGNVKPEYSINYEVGSRFRHGKLRAELLGFYNDYTNLTNICSFSGGCAEDNLDQQFDAGAAQVIGMEAYLSHEARVASVAFPLSASYTYTRGRFETSFQSADPIYGDVTAGDELPYLPRHQANGTLGVEWSHSAANIAMTYVSSMREEASSAPLSEAVATDDLFTLDVGAKVMPTQWLTVYGNVRNLLDTQRIVARRPYGARPNAPRWVQVGVKLSY